MMRMRFEYMNPLANEKHHNYRRCIENAVKKLDSAVGDVRGNQNARHVQRSLNDKVFEYTKGLS